MKKTVKKILIILVVLILIGAAIGGYFIWKHTSTYIGKDAALQAALSHAQLQRAEVFEVHTEFEKTAYSAWYDIEFETHQLEYDYSIDALTGEILASYSQPEHAG